MILEKRPWRYHTKCYRMGISERKSHASLSARSLPKTQISQYTLCTSVLMHAHAALSWLIDIMCDL